MRMAKSIDYARLEEMIFSNVSIVSICSILEIHQTTYYKRKQTDSDFQAAIERGLARRGVTVENTAETPMSLAVHEALQDNGTIEHEETVTLSRRQRIQPPPPINGNANAIGKVGIVFYDDDSVTLQVKGDKNSVRQLVTDLAVIMRI